MKHKSLFALGLLLVLAVGSCILLVPTVDVEKTASHVEPDVQATNEVNSITPTVKQKQLPYESRYGELARSLEGIYFDRELAVDEDGNLRISSDLKDIFDFFFSAIEEEELETVIARIDEYLAYQLEEPALSQSRKILSDYVAYKSALYEFEIQQSDQITHMASVNADAGQLFSGEYLNLVEQRNDSVSAMRNQFLGADVHDAFFASSEQYDNYMVQKLKISSDKNLSEEQKASMLLALDSQMPAEFIEKRKQANPVEALRTAVSSTQSQSPEQVYAARANAVGVEAANRLASLDQQRAEWDQRYSAYRVERDAIMSNSGLSAEDQAIEIDALQKSSFSSAEQVRVIALDQIK